MSGSARALALVVLGCAAALTPGCGEVVSSEHSAPASAPPNAPSLLLITLDTWRHDHADWMPQASARGLTPRMSEVAAQGAAFLRAYAPMNQTLPSHATLFTGLGPRDHGALENQYRLDERFTTLAETLAERGWSTGAVVGAAVLHASTGIAQGFQHWDLPDVADLSAAVVPERPAPQVSDAALTFLREQSADEPFFLWVHYYDMHSYYRPPADVLAGLSKEATAAHLATRSSRLASPLPPAGLQALWHAYAGEVAATDAQVGRLLDGLAELRRDDDTVVVLVGDHGEGLFEHGESTHELDVYEEQMRVPLVVRGPEVRAGSRFAEPVALEDLHASLEVMLLGATTHPSAGRDLSGALRGGTEPERRAVFVERPHLAPERIRYRSRELVGGERPGGVLVGVVHGDDKLVRQPDGGLYLFDLASDPGELLNLAGERAEVRVDLLRRLTAWIEARPAPPPGSGAEADDEQLTRLRALGYIK